MSPILVCAKICLVAATRCSATAMLHQFSFHYFVVCHYYVLFLRRLTVGYAVAFNTNSLCIQHKTLHYIKATSNSIYIKSCKVYWTSITAHAMKIYPIYFMIIFSRTFKLTKNGFYAALSFVIPFLIYIYIYIKSFVIWAMTSPMTSAMTSSRCDMVLEQNWRSSISFE